MVEITTTSKKHWESTEKYSVRKQIVSYTHFRHQINIQKRQETRKNCPRNKGAYWKTLMHG